MIVSLYTVADFVFLQSVTGKTSAETQSKRGNENNNNNKKQIPA
jgi:hypothetical protein